MRTEMSTHWFESPVPGLILGHMRGEDAEDLAIAVGWFDYRLSPPRCICGNAWPHEARSALSQEKVE